MNVCSFWLKLIKSREVVSLDERKNALHHASSVNIFASGELTCYQLCANSSDKYRGEFFDRRPLDIIKCQTSDPTETIHFSSDLTPMRERYQAYVVSVPVDSELFLLLNLS